MNIIPSYETCVKLKNAGWKKPTYNSHNGKHAKI